MGAAVRSVEQGALAHVSSRALASLLSRLKPSARKHAEARYGRLVSTEPRPSNGRSSNPLGKPDESGLKHNCFLAQEPRGWETCYTESAEITQKISQTTKLTYKKTLAWNSE